MPANFYLIFRKGNNGLFDARLRMRSLKKGGSFEDDIVYESYYGLDANYIAEMMWRDKKFSLLTENGSSSPTQRTSGCTSEISTTSTFYCAGNTPNMTMCYYTIRRNVKLKCDFDPTPEQQEEPISWIAVDDYWLGWQETEVTETQTIKKDTSIANHPEVDCVYEHLMNSNLGNGLKSILASFDNNEVYNVTFKIDRTLSNSVDATTNYLGNKNFLIRINGNQAYPDANNDLYSRIWLASTFIHEAFHAKLRQKAIALLGSDEIATWPENIDDMTLSKLAHYFQLSGEKDTKWNDIGHDWMVNNLDEMAISIREFVQTYYSTTFLAVSSDLKPYRALAIKGLSGSKFYDEQKSTIGTDSEIAYFRSRLNESGVCNN